MRPLSLFGTAFISVGILTSGFHAEASNSCNFNTVEISPNGEQSIVWYDPPASLNRSRVTLSKNEIIFVSSEGHVQTKRSSAPITNLQWLDNTDHIAVFTNPGWSYLIDAGDQSATAFGERTAALSSLHLRTQSYFTEKTLADIRNLPAPSFAELERRTAKNPVFVAGNGIFWIGGDGLQTSIFDGANATQIPPDQVRYNLAALRFAGIDGSEGPFALVGYGVDDVIDDTIFSKPIFNLKTGRQVGRVSPLAISWRIQKSRSSQTIRSDGSSFFLSASSNGSTLAILESDRSGNRKVRFVDGQGGEKRLVACATNERAVDVGDSFSRQFEVNLVSDHPGHRLGTMSVKGKPHNETLVVHFGGGPLEDPIDDLWSPVTEILGSTKADQIFVSYPGSLGVDYESSMAFLNFRSELFHESIVDLANWIKKDRKYTKIHIVGSSFGAMPAYELAKTLSNEIVKVHLIVPLMYFRQTGIVLGQANASSGLTQQIYEQSLFGDMSNRIAISEHYQTIFGSPCFRGDVTLYFAQDDNNIDENQIPVCLDGAARYVYEGASHSSILGLGKFRNDLLREFLFSDH